MFTLFMNGSCWILILSAKILWGPVLMAWFSWVTFDWKLKLCSPLKKVVKQFVDSNMIQNDQLFLNCHQEWIFLKCIIVQCAVHSSVILFVLIISFNSFWLKHSIHDFGPQNQILWCHRFSFWIGRISKFSTKLIEFEENLSMYLQF